LKLETQTLKLNPSDITSPLAIAGVPWAISCVSECDSTNREALDRCAADPELAERGLAVFSEWQSAGRGRRGARWSSSAGLDLLFSVALRPPLPAAAWGRLTHAAAFAVCQGIGSEFAPQIKWPNDIYLGQHKVSGILLESRPASGLAVIGIGLNVNSDPASLPSDLAAPATSLRAASASPAVEIPREPLAVRLLVALHAAVVCAAEGFPELLREVGQRSALLGHDVSLTLPDGARLSGRVTGFGDEGELLLQPADAAALRITNATRVRLLQSGAAQ